MKRFNPKFTIVALAFARLALAGSSAENGTDLRDPYYYHAWFGNPQKPARYCFTVSPRFGISSEVLAGQLEWAFETWVTYLREKHLIGPHATSQVSVTTQLLRMDACDGTEDLRVHFGTTDAWVEKLKTNYIQPVAFSEKTVYDEITGWGRGVLWVSGPGKFPGGALDWSDPDRLRAILLHEMGHVFGVEHVPQTIMDKNLGVAVVAAATPYWPGELPRGIDGRTRELAVCRDCTYEFVEKGHQQLQTRFKKLTGRDPVGRVTGVLRMKEGWSEKTGTLLLKDDAGAFEFSFRVQKQIAWRNSDERIFRVGGPRGGSVGNGTGVYFGWMTTPNGNRLPVTVSRNMSYAVEVVDLDGEVRLPEDDSDFFHGHGFRIVE